MPHTDLLWPWTLSNVIDFCYFERLNDVSLNVKYSKNPEKINYVGFLCKFTNY